MHVLASGVTGTTWWLVAPHRVEPPVEGSTSLVAWLAVPVAVLLVAAISSVGVVPDRHRAVVTRLGRPVRVAGPGLVVHVPGLERVATVSLRPSRLTVVAPALTRDGVAVTVTCSATFRVEDPWLTPEADPDPASATAVAVEAGVARAVGGITLVSLLADRERVEQGVPGAVSTTTQAWGVCVLTLALADVEARLTAELLHARGPHGKAGV